jgi:glutathione S-transferase
MKLYRFRYSPYARKVQMALDLLGIRHEVIEVPYLDRTELVRLTGGYLQVPVLVDEDGAVVFDSRAILERLITSPRGVRLVPSPWEGPIWAYHDFVDGPLEDVLFRIGSPAVRDAWPDPAARALYVYIKERKFGAGCVDAWQKGQGELIAQARKLLAPSFRSLAARPFLFGDEPTLADVALYGQCAMLREASPALLPRVSEDLAAFAARLDARAGK